MLCQIYFGEHGSINVGFSTFISRKQIYRVFVGERVSTPALSPKYLIELPFTYNGAIQVTLLHLLHQYAPLKLGKNIPAQA